MRRRRLLAVALLALLALFAWGGLRIADPGAGSGDVSVTLDQPATDVAVAAFEATATGDYTVTLALGNGTATRPVSTLAVEATERQVWLSSELSGGVRFRNAHVVASRDVGYAGAPASGPGAWTVRYDTWDGPPLFAAPDALAGAGDAAAVRERDAGTVVVVRDVVAAWTAVHGPPRRGSFRARDPRGNLTLRLDGAGRLRRATLRYSALDVARPDAERSVTVETYRFSRWGETDVRRPTWLPYTLQEVVADLAEEGER